MRRNLFFVWAMAALLLTVVSCDKDKEDPTLKAEYTGVSVSATGGTATITIESNVDWTVSNSDAWITINPKTGKNDGSVTVTFAANTETQERSSVFTITSKADTKQVTIKQMAAEAPEEVLTVEYTPADIPAAGGTATFTIQSNTSWTVAAQGEATWLTPSSASGNDNATITVTVAANTGAAREGTLNVTSGSGSIVRTVTINQLEASAGETTTLFDFHDDAFNTIEALVAYFDSTFTLIDKDGDGDNWRAIQFVDENNQPTGEYAIVSASFINDYGPLTPENYLVLPAVTITSNGKLSAVFHAVDAGYPQDKFKIVVSSSPITSANCQSATALHTHTLANGNPYSVNIDIPASYNGSPAYFAVCHFDCTDWYMIALDNFKITHDGPAPAPAAAPAWNPAPADKYGPSVMYQALKRVN